MQCIYTGALRVLHGATRQRVHVVRSVPEHNRERGPQLACAQVNRPLRHRHTVLAGADADAELTHRHCPQAKGLANSCVCTRWNHTKGRGCHIRDCNRRHICVLCRSEDHGVWMRNDDGSFRCKRYASYKREIALLVEMRGVEAKVRVSLTAAAATACRGAALATDSRPGFATRKSAGDTTLTVHLGCPASPQDITHKYICELMEVRSHLSDSRHTLRCHVRWLVL